MNAHSLFIVSVFMSVRESEVGKPDDFSFAAALFSKRENTIEATLFFIPKTRKNDVF